MLKFFHSPGIGIRKNPITGYAEMALKKKPEEKRDGDAHCFSKAQYHP
jgi:hypothetical protein